VSHIIDHNDGVWNGHFIRTISDNRDVDEIILIHLLKTSQSDNSVWRFIN
jgi:hypothetical protein